MVSLRDFAKRMDDRADKIVETANKKSIDVATAILRRLTFVTPVDTAKAISNWQIGIGSPVQADIGPYVFGQRTASGTAAYQAGVSKLAMKKPGETIYISNLVPYIRQLNEGSSKQAPAGFVEQAVLVGRGVLQRGSK